MGGFHCSLLSLAANSARNVSLTEETSREGTGEDCSGQAAPARGNVSQRSAVGVVRFVPDVRTLNQRDGTAGRPRR